MLMSVRPFSSNLSRAFNLHAIFLLSLSGPLAVPQQSLSSPSAVYKQFLSSLSKVPHQSLSSTHSSLSILHQTVGAQNTSCYSVKLFSLGPSLVMACH